jgi:hypothetical protein
MSASQNRAVDLIAATDLTNRIASVATRLKELGQPIRPSSQLAVFMTSHVRFVAKDIGVSIGPDAEIRMLGEGGRHFFELEIVTEELLTQTPGPLVLEKLKTALGGSVLPSGEFNSLARDTMYELVLGALLQRWGARVAFRITPDMIVTIEGQDFGLEAKRLKNHDQLLRRLSEARRQLAAVPLPGILALSVDRLAAAGSPGSADSRLAGASVDAVGDDSRGLASRIFNERVRSRALQKAKKPISALLVTATIQALVPPSNGIGIATSHHLSVVPAAKPTQRQILEKFFRHVYETIGSEGRLRPQN